MGRESPQTGGGKEEGVFGRTEGRKGTGTLRVVSPRIALACGKRRRLCLGRGEGSGARRTKGKKAEKVIWGEGRITSPVKDESRDSFLKDSGLEGGEKCLGRKKNWSKRRPREEKGLNGLKNVSRHEKEKPQRGEPAAGEEES